MNDNGNDDLERVLAALPARRAPAELRSATLAAVAAELSGRRSSWQSRIGRAVAASFFLSVAVSVGVGVAEKRRMAAWDRRPAIRSDVAELTDLIASVTNEEAAKKIEAYLLAQRPRAPKQAAEILSDQMREIQRWSRMNPLVDRN